MKLRKNNFIFCMVMLLVVIYQTSLSGGVKPGVYKVTIQADSSEITRDIWVFSKNGKFESENLGIESVWWDTADGFKIRTDTQEIQDALKKSYKLMGFSTSDISISVKTIGISGTSKGSTIKGNIKTDFNIKVKKPIKTSFATSGNMNFNGSHK